jgi:hypothetical protein
MTEEDTMPTATHVVKSPCHAVVFFSPPLVDTSLVLFDNLLRPIKAPFLRSRVSGRRLDAGTRYRDRLQELPISESARTDSCVGRDPIQGESR